MHLRMICQQVATLGDLLGQAAALAHKSPDHKKCGLGLEPVEEIQQFGRDRRVGSVVKRNRQLPRGCGTANGGAEHLGARMHGAEPRGKAFSATGLLTTRQGFETTFPNHVFATGGFLPDDSLLHVTVPGGLLSVISCRVGPKGS